MWARRIRWFWLSSVLGGALAASAAEAAPPDPLVLDWQGPPGCPDGRTVQREVLRLADLSPAPGHRVRAVGRVQVHDGVFHLRLNAELDGVAGTREFEGTSCRSVTDAAALTLALMLNPDAQVGPAASDAQPPADEVASASRPGPEQMATEPEPPAAAMPRSDSAGRDSAPWPVYFAGGATAGVRSGVLPKLGLEVGLSAAAVVGPLSLALTGSWMPPQSAPLDESEQARAEVWLLSLGTLAGWQFALANVDLGVHAGIDWTRASGQGEGISDPEQARIHWVSAQLGATGMLPITEHVAIGSGLFGLAPVARPRFTLDGQGEVYRPQPFGIRGYLGVFLKTR